MHFIGQVFVWIIEGVFLVGMAGSAIVVGITFVEDLRDFSDDKHEEFPAMTETARSAERSVRHPAPTV